MSNNFYIKINEDDKKLFEIKPNEGPLSLEVSEEKEYKLRIDGKEDSGSFDLKWAK